MSTGRQHPAPAPRGVSGTDAEDLALYQEKFRRRLPESLDELHGPTQGVVELPLHMAWSGMTSYDMSRPRQRMGLYRAVLHEGLHEDLPRYLNRDLLIQLWPVLRTLAGRTVRDVWEDAFPQLTGGYAVRARPRYRATGSGTGSGSTSGCVNRTGLPRTRA